MKAKNILFFVLFQGMVSVIVYAAEENSKLSRSVFFTARKNKRLKGHVVKRFESPSLTSRIQIRHSCLRNSWCTSTNFKMPSEKNSKGTCELNKHGAIDENTKFHDQLGMTFSLLLKVISNQPLVSIAHHCFWTRARSAICCLIELAVEGWLRANDDKNI